MILEAFTQMFSALTLSGINPRDPAIVKMLGGGTQNTAGVNVTHEKVLALPAIKRAVQIITDKMFGMPWYVFDEKPDGREWLRSHPAWNCVHWMANRDMSAPAMRQQLTQWAMLYGNGCAFIDRESDAGPDIELIPLLPDRTGLVTVTKFMAESINEPGIEGETWIKTKIGNEIKYIPRVDVLHIKGLGSNPYWGLDIVELMSEAFAGAMAKDEFSNRFFSNGANPVGFIQMDSSLDEESEETYMQSLSKAMSGLGKAHKLILLEEGAKFIPITIDPIKSQMLEGKQFDIRLLAMTIGIKPHKLIDSANSAFASLEQANHEHKDDDILPWVDKHRVEYDRKLLQGDEGSSGRVSIDVDDETLDWVPFRERAAGAVELYNNGLITKDEGRRKVNFGPSKAKRSKQYRIPSNITYEDDAAMVPSYKPDAQASATTRNQNIEAAYEILAQSHLDRLETRINAQARSKAKSGKEFLAWLDSLEPEAGPESIQPRINDLYATTKARLNELAATKNEKELADAI